MSETTDTATTTQATSSSFSLGDFFGSLVNEAAPIINAIKGNNGQPQQTALTDAYGNPLTNQPQTYGQQLAAIPTWAKVSLGLGGVLAALLVVRAVTRK